MNTNVIYFITLTNANVENDERCFTTNKIMSILANIYIQTSVEWGK